MNDDARERNREYNRQRSRRRLPVRAHTESMVRLTKRDLDLGRLLYPEDHSSERPRTRGECLGMERPCGFVSCKFNLFLDVNPRSGAIKHNYPGLEIDELPETCCLDVADQDGMSLDDVGQLLNLTRERVRQIETLALSKVLEQQELDDHSDGRDETTRRSFARKDSAA